MFQLKSPGLIIFESELYRTTSTLIIGEEYILLIDPNWLKGEVDFIQAFLNGIIEKRKPYILFTHADFDHIIGYGKFKNFTAIASRQFVENKNKLTQLQKIKSFDAQHYIERDYDIIYPEIDMVIAEEGQELNLGEDRYQFFSAPGHTDDGLITFNKTKGVIIAGDYLSNIEFPFIYHSVSAYKNTIRTFKQLIIENTINYLIVGHGDHTTQKSAMLTRIKDAESYIEQLEHAHANKTPFPIRSLLIKYPLALSMESEHQGNMELLKHEDRL